MNVPGLTNLPIRVRICGGSHAGMERPENQDNFLIADLADVRTGKDEPHGGALRREDRQAKDIALDPAGLLLMVADGMGGAAAGRIASRMATAHVLESVGTCWLGERGPSPGKFVACLRAALVASNALIHEQSTMDLGYRGMGTTATLAGVLEEYMYLGQVGDSRAYVVRNGECSQLTRDQSFANVALDEGWMSEADLERSDHRNKILQALGPTPSVEPAFSFLHLRRGDVVVLCSDGLFRVVGDDEIARAAAADPLESCGALIDLANQRGGPDNITVVVARFDGDGLAAPGPDDVVGHQPLPTSLA